MKKLLKSLIFPAISILIIAMIYAGLTIENLDNKALAAKKQNQDLSLKQSIIEKQLDEIQASIAQIINDNDGLRKNLAEAQKQILALQNRKVIENSVSVAEPVVITKVVTQKVTQEIERNEVAIIIENVGSYKVELQNGDNAFTVLERASTENDFTLTYDTYSFGVFITGIGGITPTGNQYWAFYYNGTYSNVGASSQPVQKGDTIVWRLATF
ncbi:hypothetical protein COY20_00550 [Candidatus Shapirobacteria bacterium CG_4_10_14_0_2_um_filter_40_12]|uniref:Transcobalamin-like C-terminal domain-containing protein n=1 Tax=Candidatus Shapirobacteria bacterium CG_4_10_14_0_2_um_filter_40_12 TaxID=1974871 RepID=A0A2M7TU58_9BACT|nr:MAG: hypothetical protein COY20_00550 [Candidatus Shapirobacteria bacterium CG_4_10_14_0_2_um_filter_40_12]